MADDEETVGEVMADAKLHGVVYRHGYKIEWVGEWPLDAEIERVAGLRDALLQEARDGE